MSTLVYDQDFIVEHDVESIAAEMEECARKLREKKKCRLYLGGSVYAELDFESLDAGISIEA